MHESTLSTLALPTNVQYYAGTKFSRNLTVRFQPRPMEVMVDGNGWTVIRRAETIEDMLRTFANVN